MDYRDITKRVNSAKKGEIVALSQAEYEAMYPSKRLGFVELAVGVVELLMWAVLGLSILVLIWAL